MTISFNRQQLSALKRIAPFNANKPYGALNKVILIESTPRPCTDCLFIWSACSNRVLTLAFSRISRWADETDFFLLLPFPSPSDRTICHKSIGIVFVGSLQTEGYPVTTQLQIVFCFDFPVFSPPPKCSGLEKMK